MLPFFFDRSNPQKRTQETFKYVSYSHFHNFCKNMNIVNAAEASLNTRSIIEPLQTTVQ